MTVARRETLSWPATPGRRVASGPDVKYGAQVRARGPAEMTFARLERDAWTDPGVAGAYAVLWSDFVAPSIEPLLEAAFVGAGEQVLDIAAGPGPVSRAVRHRKAEPVALDFSGAMLAGLDPTLRRLRADAAHLPIRDGRFHRAVSNLGLLHFPDPECAIREAARVVRPGGTVAFSVWAPDAKALTIVPESLAALGAGPTSHGAPGFFRYAEPGTFEASMRGAGLLPLSTERFAWDGPVRDAETFWRMFREGSARTRASILALSSADRERLHHEVVQRADAFRAPSGLRVPTSVVIGRGRRAL